MGTTDTTARAVAGLAVAEYAALFAAGWLLGRLACWLIEMRRDQKRQR